MINVGCVQFVVDVSECFAVGAVKSADEDIEKVRLLHKPSGDHLNMQAQSPITYLD